MPVIPKFFAEQQEALHAVAVNLHKGLAVVLHVAAALRHEIRDRDATRKRMLGFGLRRSANSPR